MIEEMHIPDQQLQEWANGQTGFDVDQKEHLSNCEYCQQQLAIYKNMYSSLKKMEQPVIPGALLQKIIRQLPSGEPVKVRLHRNDLVIIGLMIIMVLIPILYFNNSIKEYLSVARGISFQMCIITILGAAVFYLCTLLIDQPKTSAGKHQKM